MVRHRVYCKINPRTGTPKLVVVTVKTKTKEKNVMRPNDADGMRNRVDPDQTAVLGSV